MLGIIKNTHPMNETIKQLTSGYPSVIELPIQWGDMDLANHVNNVMYARYAESGRVAYFDSMLNNTSMMNFGTGIGPILGELNIQYKMSLQYPDMLCLATKIIDLPDAFSYRMETLIISKKHERVAAKATAYMVSYDYENRKKAPTPTLLLEKAGMLEGRELVVVDKA